MSAPSSMPWMPLLEAIGEQRFEEIKADLAARRTDDLDRDAFVLNGVVASLLRELVPEDAPAEAVTSYAALLHMLYAAWARGWPATIVDEDALRRALTGFPPLSPLPSPLFSYVQVPPLLVWAQPSPEAPHEPLHGLFVVAAPHRLRVLAIVGAHELRKGFTTMEADAPLPLAPPGPRADGSPAFASVIPGGERKRLISLVSPGELAALALLAQAATGA